MAPLEINVTGSATAYHLAERSVLTLKISSQSRPTAQEADTVVATVLNSLCDAIAPYCSSKTPDDKSNSTAPIAQYSLCTSETTRGHGRSHDNSSMSFSKASRYETTYSTSAEISIDFRDFDLLARIAVQVGSMENVKITQLHWTLTPETHKDLESRVRKDAAREAIRKARDYADVCGDGKGGRVEAVWIKEWEAFTRLERNRAHVGKERVGVVQKSEWDYEPVDVGVEGRVDGKFVVGG